MTTTMSSFTKIPENLGFFLEHELGGCLRSVKQLSKASFQALYEALGEGRGWVRWGASGWGWGN